MGGAILSGLASLEPCPDLLVIDPSEAVAERYATSAIKHSPHVSEIASASVVILAVKPQIGAQVAVQVQPVLRQDQLLISILAGTTLETLTSWFPNHQRIIRSMPNTPMAIGKGMVGLAPLPGLDQSAISLAKKIFEISANVLVVQEEAMDALTAVSGSGPAYVFKFAESLHQAAIHLGFSTLEAKILVETTLQGSVDYLVHKSAEESHRTNNPAAFPAATLREQVTSPAGTTAAALTTMDEGCLMELMQKALEAARNRSIELARSAT